MTDPIYHTQPAARDPLHDAMTAALRAAGWTPKYAYTLFGPRVSYQHDNGTTVSHADALAHWREKRDTPPPF